MDDWLGKKGKGFEFLLKFVPKERFKVAIYNRINRKLMFEGEYNEIDKKHHFKNIPWDPVKKKDELRLKIGIGPDEMGFGQVNYLNTNILLKFN